MTEDATGFATKYSPARVSRDTDHLIEPPSLMSWAMLDADLAAVYGVTTKRLNEQVRRNTDRFPADFVFQLTDQELIRSRSHLRP